jgi:membrane protein implicated in regulation of membrane protease activity
MIRRVGTVVIAWLVLIALVFGLVELATLVAGYSLGAGVAVFFAMPLLLWLIVWRFMIRRIPQPPHLIYSNNLRRMFKEGRTSALIPDPEENKSKELE